MKKDDFYLCLNVLNILLCLCTYLTLLVFFVIFSIAENSFIPICLIFLSILVKLSKVAIELKTNINSRKSTLLLAFTYDVVIMLYCILFFSIKEYRFEWAYIPVYEIMTLGGVCMFYITLFGLWKIQGKLE